jgi:hypothetical protein
VNTPTAFTVTVIDADRNLGISGLVPGAITASEVWVVPPGTTDHSRVAAATYSVECVDHGQCTYTFTWTPTATGHYELFANGYDDSGDVAGTGGGFATLKCSGNRFWNEPWTAGIGTHDWVRCDANDHDWLAVDVIAQAPGSPPSAQLLGPTIGTQYQPLVFTAIVSDPDGNIGVQGIDRSTFNADPEPAGLLRLYGDAIIPGEVYFIPSGGSGATRIGHGDITHCSSPSTCTFTVVWTPLQAGTFSVFVNAYDRTGWGFSTLKCSGNRPGTTQEAGTDPSIWVPCDPAGNDALTVTIAPATPMMVPAYTPSPAQPYEIGAFYFAVFNHYMDMVTQGTESVYGRVNDWWGGVRDFYEGRNQGLVDDYSGYKPAIGYYNDTDPSVMERHIVQARENGLSYFDFYYYWDKVGHRENQRWMAGIDSFLLARNSNDFRYMVSIVSGQWELAIPESDFTLVSEVLVYKHFSRSNYLRTDDGRPILYFLGPTAIGDGSPEQLAAFIQELRDTSRAAIGVNPFILMNYLDLSQSTGSEFGWSQYGESLRNVVDGYRPFAAGFPTPSDLPSFYANHLAVYGSKPSQLSMMTGLDDRARIEVQRWGDRPMTIAEYWLWPGFGASQIAEEIGDLKQLIDQAPTDINRKVSLYAWNEWHEGGKLEPNVAQGALLLKTVAEAFGLVRGEDPCRDTGLCTYSTNSSNQPASNK